MIHYKIDRHGQELTVALSGSITECVDDSLARLAAALDGRRVTFDCRGIERVNSAGALRWRRFLLALRKDRMVALRDCSLGLMDFMLMLPTFLGKTEVQSFYAPYDCRCCRRTFTVLINAASLRKTACLPVEPCPSCAFPLASRVSSDEYLEALDSLAR